jgi:hypothetical protein
MKVLWLGMWWVLTPHRPSSFEVNTDTIPIGVLLLVVSWFMEMAAEMREENELTV